MSQSNTLQSVERLGEEHGKAGEPLERGSFETDEFYRAYRRGYDRVVAANAAKPGLDPNSFSPLPSGQITASGLSYYVRTPWVGCSG